MNTPDENHPKKHFFKIPTNFDKSSQEEQNAFYDQIIATLGASRRYAEPSWVKPRPHP